MIVPTKAVKCFPNNKPWVTSDLKLLLNEKKRLLASKDREQLKMVQKEINKEISLCKSRYKTKVENMFKCDTRSAWNGLRCLTGMKKSPVKPDVANAKEYCNELNYFYARFDKYDFSGVRECICNFHQGRDAVPVVICEDDVRKCLQLIKVGKAAGPDRISGHVLKLCADPLSSVLCKIYQQSLDNSCIPSIWKTSEIIPVPKRNPPACNNDYRPVALTPIMMKCFEKVMKNVLCAQVSAHVDDLQFAYRKNRCVEDATLSLTDYVLQHLDKPNSRDHKHYAKILFVDFSSAFNTIQPHLMMQKLNCMGVNANMILWINDFLTGRLQYVKFLDCCSDMLVTNTGAPQGCVLSPLLFTLYTSDCRSECKSCQLFKYADDTALAGKCDNNDILYRTEVDRFTSWCEENYLELNVKKTKEMIIDYRTTPVTHNALYIGNELVETVTEYKYLGTIIDSDFTFRKNVDSIYKKVQTRLYFVRQLSKLRIDNKILELFYTAIVQSVMSFAITCWFGNCHADSKSKLTKAISNCRRLGVGNTISLLDLYRNATTHRCKVIQSDATHPLHASYQMLPSGRRLRAAKCRTARYSRSFVPSSIRMLNA